MIGKHLLGIYEKAFSPQSTWQEKLSAARRLGFDYVEISVDESDERIERLYWTEENMEALRRCCVSEGVPILSMCLSAHRRYPLGSANGAVREKAREIMERAIKFAVAMGIRTIQLAGYDVYYEASTPFTRAAFAEGLKWAASIAEKYQVMLAMEIMDTRFMNSITKQVVYEEWLNSPWYRVYPDLGNLSAWPENDAEAELKAGRGRIVAVHLKDTLRVSGSFEGKFRDVPFGGGCVDFVSLFRQLEDQGYNGPYLIEMWHQNGSRDEAEIRKAREWLERQFARAVVVYARGGGQPLRACHSRHKLHTCPFCGAGCAGIQVPHHERAPCRKVPGRGPV